MSPAVRFGGRPRAFDHDEAVRLRRGGMKLREIAARMGVSQKSVERVVNPEYGKRQAALSKRLIASKKTSCKGGCGQLVWNHYKESKTPSGYCAKCGGAARNVVRHGTANEYRQGCRCDECRAAATEARRRRRHAERPRGQVAHADYASNPCGIMWCRVCRDDALPSSITGRCMWCDTLLVKVVAA